MKLYETINAANWCKHALAKTRAGCIVGSTRPSAVTWCLMGMQYRLGRRVESRLAEAIVSLYPKRVNVYPRKARYIVISFNDHPDTTVEDVIRVCKLADV